METKGQKLIYILIRSLLKLRKHKLVMLSINPSNIYLNADLNQLIFGNIWSASQMGKVSFENVEKQKPYAPYLVQDLQNSIPWCQTLD